MSDIERRSTQGKGGFTDPYANYSGSRTRTPQQEYDSVMSAINDRLGNVERMIPKIDGIVTTLAALTPKVEEIHKFTTHIAPNLATNHHVSNEISGLNDKLRDKLDDKLSKGTFYFLTATVIAMLGVIAAYLAVPGFNDFVVKHLGSVSVKGELNSVASSPAPPVGK